MTLLVGLSNWAQEGVAVGLSKDHVRLAEQFEFSYVLKSATDSNYRLKTIDGEIPITSVNAKDENSYSLEIIKESYDSNYVKNDTFYVYKSFILTSWETGEFFIPPLEFIGKTDTLFSFPKPLKIARIDIDTTQDIKPIKPIVLTEDVAKEEDKKNYEKQLFWWVIGIIIFLLLIAGLVTWLLIKKRKSHTETERVYTPDEIALRELQTLKKELAEDSNNKHYYSELTRILRSYIEARYRISTFEKTSSEILKSLKSKELESITFKELKHLLELSDLVKFAKNEPTFEDRNNAFQQVVNFINKTKAFFHFNES